MARRVRFHSTTGLRVWSAEAEAFWFASSPMAVVEFLAWAVRQAQRSDSVTNTLFIPSVALSGLFKFVCKLEPPDIDVERIACARTQQSFV